MKQVVQHVRRGDVRVVDVPPPAVRPGQLLVRVHASVISAGTERSGVSERKQSLLSRAKKNPELVARLFTQLRSQGVSATYLRVMNQLDSAAQLGYSCAGVVVAVGKGVDGWSPGDRVACSGAGYANHAEMVSVPKHLCARVPEGVPFESAAYATIASIALQGVRQTAPSIGESVVVIGLGLVGQLTAQILRANGCIVIGVDPDPTAVGLAKRSGAHTALMRNDDVSTRVRHLTGGVGADAVIITAATPSVDPVRLAGDVARDRARVVLVGDVGLTIPRTPYYLKELEFRLSRSYGPGRYDRAYEEGGVDYPVGYVRWTEQRNMEEVLRLMSTEAIQPTNLTTHRFRVDLASEAFSLLADRKAKRDVRPFGIVLEYPDGAGAASRPSPKRERMTRPSGRGEPATIGFIGAGSFAQSMLLPELKKVPSVHLKTVCTSSGITASNAAKRFGFSASSTDHDEVVADEKIGTVFIASRHNLHASQTLAALRAGKNVFVEKPLVMRSEELADIERQLLRGEDKKSPILMVGFNRRFSPSVVQMKEFFAGIRVPTTVHYRVHAGPVSPGHWTLDPNEGGGRIVGEVCHFIDTIQFLTGSRVMRIIADRLGKERSTSGDDSISVILKCANGALGTIQYLANGDPAVPKEFIEMFGGGRAAMLDNFQRLVMYSEGRKSSRAWQTVDKGHGAEVQAFMRAVVAGGPSPIPLEDILHVTRVTFSIEEALRTGVSVRLDEAL